MKGGQLVHTIYTVTDRLWKQYDNPRVKDQRRYRGFPFTNIIITASPVPWDPSKSLTLVKIEFGLTTITSNLQAESFWPSAVTAHIKNRQSSRDIGIIEITDSSLSGLPVNEKESSLSDPTQHNNSSMTASTGEGILTFNSTCNSVASPCQPSELVRTGRPIAEKIWLEVFHSIISRCFIYDQFKEIRGALPPSRSWSATDESRTVEMTVQFYDAALSVLTPLHVYDVVWGLLQILERWARRDVWKECWGLIQEKGVPEASVQIRIISP